MNKERRRHWGRSCNHGRLSDLNYQSRATGVGVRYVRSGTQAEEEGVDALAHYCSIVVKGTVVVSEPCIESKHIARFSKSGFGWAGPTSETAAGPIT